MSTSPSASAPAICAWCNGCVGPTNGDGRHDTATVHAIDPATGGSTLVAAKLAGPVDGTGINARFTYFRELGGVAYQPSFATDMMFLPTRALP